MKQAQKIIFLIIGLICILVPELVAGGLPYILGAAMLLACAQLTSAYVKNYKQIENDSEKLSLGLMMGIMGAFFLVKGQKALGAIGTTWAMIGIIKASKSLNLLVRAIHVRAGWLALTAEFAIRIGLALLLLFDPFEHITAHIAILGLEIIFSQVKFSKKKV